MELRKDYILDRWTYVAANRGKRPDQFREPVVPRGSGSDMFSPGSEHLTPQELGRVSNPEGGWKMRWFPNKFPAVTIDEGFELHDEGFFQYGTAYGTHDIIVELPESDKQLWDLEVSDFKDVLKLYKERVITLSKLDKVQYVVLFKNHGSKGGASLQHSHTQIMTLGRVPSLPARELEVSRAVKNCPLLKATQEEIKKEDRIIAVTEDWVSLCPWAPRYNFEAWILPRKRLCNFMQLRVRDLNQMAEHFVQILGRLRELNAPYNFCFHYDPRGDDLPLHCEITPRLNTRAGFELASDDSIVTMSPEQAAGFYRGEVK